MLFRVSPEIFARFPGLRIAVAVAHGLDNTAAPVGVAALWRDAWRGAAEAAQYGNAQSHPRVQPWRERFRALGVSGKEFPSSVEALLRRALKGGAPFSINPLVDFYNALSLRHVLPAGGFDLAEIEGPLELRLTRDGDRFLALDADEPLDVPPGEVAYADGTTVLTRHFVWRQARTALITPATRSAILVSEALGEVGPEAAEAVLADLVGDLREHFGVVATSTIVDQRQPEARW